MRDKVCVRCGVRPVGWHRMKFCSDACAKEAVREAWRKRERKRCTNPVYQAKQAMGRAARRAALRNDPIRWQAYLDRIRLLKFVRDEMRETGEAREAIMRRWQIPERPVVRGSNI